MDYLDEEAVVGNPRRSPDCSTCDAWHSNRRVPIALVFAIMVQSLTGVWWAAKLDERVNQIEIRTTAQTQDRFHKSEALQYFALRDVEIANNRKQIESMREDINRSLDKFATRFDRMSDKLDKISGALLINVEQDRKAHSKIPPGTH